MSATTRFLSRLIGLYCILMALAMAAHRQATVDTITAMVHDAPLLFLCGILAVTGGLAIVLNHNVWSGGGGTVVVTLVGWVSLIKGALMMFLTPNDESAVFLDGLHYAQLFYVYCGISFGLGAYLTWWGFSGPRNA
jgi:hypothetical protein